MSTALLTRPTQTTTNGTCEVYAGSLVLPCPNPATSTASRSGRRRAVCPAHAGR